MRPGAGAEQLERLRGIYPLADDDPRWRHGPRALVEAVLAGGAQVLQLRLKRTSDRDALVLARFAAERTRKSGALLFVDDRFDLADLAGADGVHLGLHDLAPERIPREIRRRLLVGLSTHTLEQVDASRSRDIDYVAFGPVFGTASKESEYPARGVEALSEAVRRAGRPVVAIGGIAATNLDAVRETGARAAAVISAIADAEEPARATAELNERFLRTRERPA